MAQWASLSVSVFDFRTATSEMIFQDFTPMFLPMSIEKLDCTDGSQVYSCKHFSKPICESLFFAYCPANFEVASPLILGKQKAEIPPVLSFILYFISSRLLYPDDYS